MELGGFVRGLQRGEMGLNGEMKIKLSLEETKMEMKMDSILLGEMRPSEMELPEMKMGSSEGAEIGFSLRLGCH